MANFKSMIYMVFYFTGFSCYEYCGTAGFLVAADQYMREQTDDYMDLTAKEAGFQKNQAFVGVELVLNTRRLALMNCLLHGMEGDDGGVVMA